jgi:starch synthase (maltosyl-transferring)
MIRPDMPRTQRKIVIENVQPSLAGGRYPVKRIIGDLFTVGADIYRDGHDSLLARIRYRRPKARSWLTQRMRYDFNSDRWFTDLMLNEIGRWRLTIEAWTDHFGSWHDALQKKVDAGLDVSLELLEGAALIESAGGHATDDVRPRLKAARDVLADSRGSRKRRVETALNPELRAVMEGIVDDGEVTRSERQFDVVVDPPSAGFAAWYEMFPRSHGKEPGKHGTFREAESALPRLAELGFDVVYLPPIHPIGHTFRKGRNNALTVKPGDPGSPWAIGSEQGGHTAVAPELGTLADFDHFVAAAEDLGMAVALDYALQCSPDHPWVKDHPDWFVLRPDGSIKYAENPPKKYQDIYPLDFWCEDRDNLWAASKEIVEFWIQHGVKTFRVDNPHTKPFAFWEWMITSVKQIHPEVVFLAEAFTRPKKMWGLARLGFSQSYTHFTWKNTSYELRDLFNQLHGTELVEYFRGNLFTNTPDILHEYLQQGGRPAFRVRLLLAATLSPLYGIYSGFELCENVPREPGSEEYLDSEKYEIRARDWESSGNINDDIRLINRIRRDNPALQRQGNLEFHPCDNDNLLFYSRTAWQNDLLIVVNLDPHQPQGGTIQVPVSRLSLGDAAEYEVRDLLTGNRYTWRGSGNYIHLDPTDSVAHVFRVQR